MTTKHILLATAATLLLCTTAHARIYTTGSISTPVGPGDERFTDFIIAGGHTFVIGHTAAGELNITNNLYLYAGVVNVGDGGTGIINIQDTASRLIMADQFTIGTQFDSEVHVSDGGRLYAQGITLGDQGYGLLQISGLTSQIEAEHTVNQTSNAGSRLELTDNATGAFADINIHGYGPNENVFYINNANATSDQIYVSGDNARLEIINQSSFHLNNSVGFDIEDNATVIVRNNSSLDTTNGSLFAVNGRFIIDESSLLTSQGAMITTRTSIHDSTWLDTGTTTVGNEWDVVNTTIQTQGLNFELASIIDITLDHSTWTNNTSTAFINDAGTHAILTLNNNSRFTTQFLATGVGEGDSTININSGSIFEAEDVWINDPYFGANPANAYINVDGTASQFNVTNQIEFLNDGIGYITLSNGGQFNSANQVVLGTAPGHGGEIIIGARTGPATAAGQMNITNGLVFGDGVSELTFNHTDTNYTNDTTLISNTTFRNGNINFKSGTTILTGDYSAFTGFINVQGGDAHLNGTQPLNAASYITVDAPGTLHLYGNNHTVETVFNTGNIILNEADNLNITITGDYNGGTISAPGRVTIEAQLEDDSSPTDHITVQGNTHGYTTLHVTNRTGLGGDTVEGIQLVRVLGNSDGHFTLNPDYVQGGTNYIMGGAYAYALYKGTLDGTTDIKSWYLRSHLVATDVIPPKVYTTPTPTYSPIASVLESYPQALQNLNKPDTLDKRLAHHFKTDENHKYGVWFYAGADHIKNNPHGSTTDTSYKTNSYEMRAGIDIPVLNTQMGDLVTGIGARYINGHSKTNSDMRTLGTGKIDSQGYGIIPTLTWYGHNGFYIDGVFQATWYQSDLKSHQLNRRITHDNDAFGYAASAEIGQRMPLTDNLDITMQGQLIYSHIKYDGFVDDMKTANIQDGRAKALTARIGGSLEHTTMSDTAKNNLYAKLNVYNDFSNSSKSTIAEINNQNPVDFNSKPQRTWAGIAIGGTHSWANDTFNLYGEIGATTAIKHSSDNYGLNCSVGFTYRF